MDTKAIEKTIRLLAKAGLFFASADGKYDVREKNFIENFISRLADTGGDKEEARALVAGYLDRRFTLDEVIADTKDLLESFNEAEKGVITLMLDGFLEEVIEADGRTEKVEADNLDAWQKAIAE